MNPLDRRAWQTWNSAWDTVDAGRADGVGLAITPALHLTAIDLDDCLDGDGQVEERAHIFLDLFSETYVERSPSGTGLHLRVRGPCPPAGDGSRASKSLIVASSLSPATRTDP